MNWNSLQHTDQLQNILKESSEKNILIFKHSTTCSISRATLNRLERNWKEEEIDVKSYFLDLLTYRELSNKIAEQFDVAHQSPQVLIIRHGKSVYNRSHFDIDFKQIKAALKN